MAMLRLTRLAPRGLLMIKRWCRMHILPIGMIELTSSCEELIRVLLPVREEAVVKGLVEEVERVRAGAEKVIHKVLWRRLLKTSGEGG